MPFLSTLRALGCGVSVLEDSEVVEIESGDKNFVLQNHKLFLGSGDYLCEVPGYDISLLDRKGEPGELYMEHKELLQLLCDMGFSNVIISIDVKGREVAVNLD